MVELTQSHIQASVLASLGPLPPAPLLFPVQARHSVGPDLVKLADPMAGPDQDYPAVLAAKLAALRQRPDALLLPEPAWSHAHWRALWQALGLDQAAWVRSLGLGLDADQVHWGAFEAQKEALGRAGLALAGQPEALALTLALQGEWVVVSGAGRFLAGSVCMPSGWAPGEKFGQPLAQIHAPVADGEALRKSSDAMIRAMSQKGPFVRHVWTLCRNASLARHPHWLADTRPEGPRALYFRCERQTTLPLPGLDSALFLIRVQVRPLEVLLAGPQRAERLRLLQQSLASMSDAVIAYKNLAGIREQVLAMALAT